MKTLEAKIEAGNAEVSDFFRKTLYPELAQKAGTQDANALLSKEKSEVSRLQNTLAELGPRVMGIRLLLGDERAYAIVVTAQARKKFELKATPAELRSKVLQVRDDLRTPASDPKPHLAELYAMAIAPFGDELNALEQSSQEKGRVPTLLWSLDGAMRYLPMAAMYDGRHYLAERFNNILFTPESYGHMTSLLRQEQGCAPRARDGIVEELWRPAGPARRDAGAGCRGARPCRARVPRSDGRNPAARMSGSLTRVENAARRGIDFSRGPHRQSLCPGNGQRRRSPT